MKKIITFLKNIPIDENVIQDFFSKYNLYDINLEKVLEKIIYYPIDDVDLMGAYPKINNDYLIDYKVRVSKADNLYNSLVYIHEIIHGIILENNLYQKYNSNYEEVLPMLFEDLFIRYLKDQNILKIYEDYKKEIYLDKKIDNNYKEARNIIDNYLLNIDVETITKLLKNEIKVNDIIEHKKKIH